MNKNYPNTELVHVMRNSVLRFIRFVLSKKTTSIQISSTVPPTHLSARLPREYDHAVTTDFLGQQPLPSLSKDH